MLTDFITKKDNIEISYITPEGSIAVNKLILPDGYFDIEPAEEYEVEGNPDIVPGLRAFKSRKPLKFVPANRFGHHARNYFIDNILKTMNHDLYENVMALRIPKLFSVDIEIEVTDKYGYSNQNKVENRILWISVCNDKLNSFAYALKTDIFKPFIGEDNRIKPEFIATIRREICKIFKESVPKAYKLLLENLMDVVFFDNESDMLKSFLSDVKLHYHTIIGHNFLGYDWTYITNRCKKLGIPITIASPTNSTKTIQFGKKRKKGGVTLPKPKVDIPSHRIILDNMIQFQESLSYNNLEAYNLDFLGNLVLKTGKISYEGNLKRLYEEEPLKYMMYAFVDAILVMLLQEETNLSSVDFYESYLNKIPFLQLSQNCISESLVYYNLKKKGLYLPTSEHNHAEDQNYTGGYVKQPTKKEVDAALGLDYSGLYVNIIIALGISTEVRVDKIDVDEWGYPNTENAKAQWAYWKSKSEYFMLSPQGYVYDNREEPLFVSIEKETLAKRKIFKQYAEKIYMELETKIEKRIKELENADVSS